MADQNRIILTKETLPLKSCDHNTFSHDNGAIKVSDEITVPPDVVPEKEDFSCSKISNRSRWTFGLVAVGMFFNGNIIYFMVPFLMKEGVNRGVSETVVGFIFSTMHLIIFIFSPLYGQFMPKIGARFMYVSGALVAGISTMIFGFVEFCHTPAAFIGTSIICRVMSAIGASAYCTAAFAILAHEFPDHASTVFSITESVNGLGFMIGPVIGGSLFEVGGFLAPCIVVGGMMVLNGIQLYVLLPEPKVMPNTHKGSVLTLTKSLLFDIAMLNTFAGFLAIGFMDPTLSVRLEKFGLPPSLVGLGYLTSPCAYAIASPIVGYLTDVKNIPTFLLLFSSFFVGISFLLIGPCPGLTFLPDELWLVLFAFGLTGTAFCCSIAPCMRFMIMGAVEVGFPEHLDTYGLLSGMFYAQLCAGGLVGNFMGGALLDRFGFAFSSMIVGFVLLGTFVITATYFACRRLAKISQKNKDSKKWSE